jgi:carboxyl-terminal processing protease
MLAPVPVTKLGTRAPRSGSAFARLGQRACLVGILCLIAADPERLWAFQRLAGASDSSTQIDLEAVARLEEDGLFFRPGSTPDLPSVQAFTTYLLTKDPFADFLTRDEYTLFRKMLGEQHAGIGLELERDHSGRVLCYPDPGGPAARAGVAAGDQLVAIDGHPVQGRALPTLVAAAAGEAGSPLVIDIANKDRTIRRLRIVRIHSATPSVVEERYGARSIVRISSFTPNTREELEFILLHRNGTDPLILDLRGNRGGDLNAAIDCAMLFLNPGDIVVSVQGRRGARPYVSAIAGRAQRQPVLLFQDQGTASAAEVFIAALRENGRGVSIGKKTFGKGTKQDLIELRSGAVLILTTGYLLTPRGNAIDGHGLAPDYFLPGNGSDMTSYLEQANRLSNRNH